MRVSLWRPVSYTHLDVYKRQAWRVDGLAMAALATIWTVALINCASVAAGGRTALAATLAKVLLVAGVGLAAFLFAPGSWSNIGGSGLQGTCEGVASSARGGVRCV